MIVHLMMKQLKNFKKYIIIGKTNQKKQKNNQFINF